MRGAMKTSILENREQTFIQVCSHISILKKMAMLIQHQLNPMPLTIMGSMICQETYGNGAPIGFNPMVQMEKEQFGVDPFCVQMNTVQDIEPLTEWARLLTQD